MRTSCAADTIAGKSTRHAIRLLLAVLEEAYEGAQAADFTGSEEDLTRAKGVRQYALCIPLSAAPGKMLQHACSLSFVDA